MTETRKWEWVPLRYWIIVFIFIYVLFLPLVFGQSFNDWVFNTLNFLSIIGRQWFILTLGIYAISREMLYEYQFQRRKKLRIRSVNTK